MMDFTNTQIAFSYKTNADLRNAYLLFNVMKHSLLVKLGKIGVNIALKFHFPLAWVVKPTLYKQFVGGETIADCQRYIDLLDKFKIKSTLDYSAEGTESHEGIQSVFEETLRSIDNAKGNDKIAYAVFKPSTIVMDKILEKASEHRSELTEQETKEFEDFKARFMALCQRAYDNDVRLLVDAEDYCYQNALDKLTDEAMRKFNTKRAIVFATLQMYRHDRMPYLEKIYQDAVDNNYIAGIKFVRGAYMDEERDRATKLGYPDPICKDKQTTDKNFDKGVKYVINHIDKMELFIGTHNEESNYNGASCIDKKGIDRGDKRIFFAQLLGMSDNISFNLADERYNVTKYVPYAPVKDVLPYLLRRATENTSIVGQTTRELDMLNMELARRRAD